MKELSIHHIHDGKSKASHVRVSYRAEKGAQAQERETDLHFAVTDEEHRLIQWYLEEYLIYPWGEFRFRAIQVEQLMERLGVELFAAVFSNRETQALYAHAVDDLANTRVVIHASSPEGIALPWEFMRDPTRQEYGDLARLTHSFVRSQSDLFLHIPPAPADTGMFNILMVICRPDGPEDDVPFQSVVRRLLELFRPHRDRIHLDVLRPPTFEQLSRVLSDASTGYHVLHFDGHGGFPQRNEQVGFPTDAEAQGELLFEGEDGRPRAVTGEELGSLLAGKGVPLVVLNACQSGMTRPESLYPSIGNQLLKAGVRGIVAMAYSVYVQTAVRFMARLYEGLINGREVARAVALAREELRAHPQRLSPIGEVTLRDWVVPVFFEAAPTRLLPKPITELELDANLLQEQQAEAGKEIDCPEPPAFGFVGRDNAILELERAFQTETIVLLEGMAGVGKTEAAIGFARWQAETGALGGPVFFHRFERYLPLESICERVGHEFNRAIRQQLKADWHLLDQQQRQQISLAILKRTPCLLVWDNFEPVAGFPAGTSSDWNPAEQRELRVFLSELRGGKTKVLITSRRDELWLGSIYRRVELNGLKLVEAQDLAVRVMQRAGVDANRMRAIPQYNDLLLYLGGNPLAIQIILPELKRLTPDDLMKALQTGEAKLGGDDPTEGRERSLTVSLAYRLDALDPILHERLGILTLFQGFVNAAVLAEMSSLDNAPPLIHDLSRGDWGQVLDVATQFGLLHRIAEDWYSIHPALPWFFHDVAHTAFPDCLEWLDRAFAKTYSSMGYALLESFKTEPALSMRKLQLEESNLKNALAPALRFGLLNDAMGVLYGLVQLLTKQGRWLEWERIVATVENKITNSDRQPLPGREKMWPPVLALRQEIAHHLRRFDDEEQILQVLRNHFERVGDVRNHAKVLEQTGNIAFELREFAEAKRWYEQALARAQDAGDEHEQGILLHKFGMIAQEQRQLEEAQKKYREALSLRERIDDEWGMASSLHQLAVLAQDQWQFNEAEQFYAQCLTTWNRIGDDQEMAKVYHNLGAMAQDRRRFDEAECCYRECLVVRERTGDELGQAQVLRRLGAVAHERGHLDEAEQWCRRSLEIAQQIGDDHAQGAALLHIGNITGHRGDSDAATKFYEQSLTIAERISDGRGIAACLQQLGTVAFHRGDLAAAFEFYNQSLAVRLEIGDKHGAAQAFHQMGNILAANGQLEDAERAFGKALEIAERIGYGHGKATTLHQMGVISEERGDLSRAEQFYQHAEAIIVQLNDPTKLVFFRDSLARVRGKQQRPEGAE